ncbi:MAG TPA: hypothetical protein VMU50_07325 [Polyangia bacterium]|nr:hypothetical protein [Polyangia bacterium]
MKRSCLRFAWALAAVACSSGSGSGGGGTGGGAGPGTDGGPGPDGSAAGPGTGGALDSAGAGGHDAGAGGGGPTDAALAGDAGGADDGNGDGNGVDLGGAGTALNGFLFNVPCMTAPQNGDCQGAPADLAKSVTIAFGGEPGVTYDVSLHICGAVEGRPYTGCTDSQATYFCTDGVAATSGFNPTYPIYEMKVSAPAHAYYVNNRDLKDDLFQIDYAATVKIQGGASLTFSTTSVGTDMYTPALKGHNFTCPGVPNITQPYAGQFFYITTESVTPAP